MTTPNPVDLWRQSDGDPETYERLLRDAGLAVDSPRASVARIGWCTYSVEIHHDLCTHGWTSVWGRSRANKRAARMLSRYVRDEKRRADVREITT
jgi:hypothetical protein